MSSKSQPEKFGTPSVNLKLKGNSNTNSNTYQIPHQSESECLTQTETLGLSDGARLHQTAQTRAPAIISSDWNDTLLNGSQHQHEHDFYVDPKSKTTTDAETVSCKCLNVSFKISNLSLVLDKDDGQPQDKGGFPQFDPRSEFFSNSESAFIQNSKKLVGHSSNEYSHTLIESLLEKPVKLVSGESEDPQVAIAYLIVTKEFHGWVMYTCFNCKTMTHAVSRVPGTGENQSKHIYVNYGMMLKPSQQQEVISANPNYSKLFRIVTYPSTGITSKPSTLKPSVVDLLRDVEERSVDYVEEERDNMKRRIREYEAEQLAKFKDLQNVVASNRQNIERQIWAVFKEANEDADSAYEKSVEEISDNLGNLPRHSNINGGKKGRSSSFVDEMFDPFLDEQFNDGDGDDEIFTDDEMAAPNYQSRSSGRADTHDQLAASVPIPIMRHLRVSTSRASLSSDEDESTPQPQDMQASMKALAQSVGGDGTEMFGDLPRHRFNTYSYSRRSHRSGGY